ncbi:unnamed protein product (macronuclear) [Paramecium tetraurelia]|uniref:Uncharacterized protein n=1 Tax=Paramecium tetraurelia TaxID=5888 RepID=A0DEQ5_PARTE|nr:uncharacterized protein GSPATT00016348001 [Paramecium tetraurelia]CAK81522.1 unnamed protein product [Paramecium tetraurelia]|eukprot:XP_001448919.1 hypothetical protein (macronuclear) [Paramecium tetraurelia strain d4-2]
MKGAVDDTQDQLQGDQELNNEEKHILEQKCIQHLKY